MIANEGLFLICRSCVFSVYLPRVKKVKSKFCESIAKDSAELSFSVILKATR